MSGASIQASDIHFEDMSLLRDQIPTDTVVKFFFSTGPGESVICPLGCVWTNENGRKGRGHSRSD